MAKSKKVETYTMEDLKHDTVYKVLHRFYWDSKGESPKVLIMHSYAVDELIKRLKDYKLGSAIYSFNDVTQKHQFHKIPVDINDSLNRMEVRIKT